MNSVTFTNPLTGTPMTASVENGYIRVPQVSSVTGGWAPPALVKVETSSSFGAKGAFIPGCAGAGGGWQSLR